MEIKKSHSNHNISHFQWEMSLHKGNIWKKLLLRITLFLVKNDILQIWICEVQLKKSSKVAPNNHNVSQKSKSNYWRCSFCWPHSMYIKQRLGIYFFQEIFPLCKKLHIFLKFENVHFCWMPSTSNIVTTHLFEGFKQKNYLSL